MGRRGAGQRLNDQQRMEIIELINSGGKVKNVDLAKKYGVSEGAIRKLRSMKDVIRDRYLLGSLQHRDTRKRGGSGRNVKFERELYEWIVQMREQQAYQLVPLTQTAVRQHAIELSKSYEKMESFKASPGWFVRFCSRHRLDPPMVSPSFNENKNTELPLTSPMSLGSLEVMAANAANTASATMAVGMKVKVEGSDNLTPSEVIMMNDEAYRIQEEI